ncbi:hypothetical protein SNN69_004339 [Cronobacter sakazakii]|nr:hypothetical protein [Cronobacter sakazakii]HDU8040207.1 hypothetical protein [Cronobacter sakazakii]HDU8043132.1 hypothetical protein [Cronobacter sakazakii]
MKKKLLLGALFSSLFSTTVLASTTTESQVALAKNELAEALVKSGLLTNSFTEKARKNPQVAGKEIANSMAKDIDNFVVQGINNGESCESISQRISQGMGKALAQGQEEYPISAAAKKAASKVPLTAAKYAYTECLYLTE